VVAQAVVFKSENEQLAVRDVYSLRCVLWVSDVVVVWLRVPCDMVYHMPDPFAFVVLSLCL